MLDGSCHEASIDGSEPSEAGPIAGRFGSNLGGDGNSQGSLTERCNLSRSPFTFPSYVWPRPCHLRRCRCDPPTGSTSPALRWSRAWWSSFACRPSSPRRGKPIRAQRARRLSDRVNRIVYRRDALSRRNGSRREKLGLENVSASKCSHSGLQKCTFGVPGAGDVRGVYR